MSTVNRYRHVEHCMGTVFSFDLEETLPATELGDALAWLHRTDGVFSPYRYDSDISRLNRGELTVADCAPEVPGILQLCRDLTVVTNGYFDAWVTGVLDPCGVVKGWAIEALHQRFREAGSRRHCINGGGDIRCYTLPSGSESDIRPWRLGVSDPQRLLHLATVVEGSDFALATSGSLERGDHILNPHTHQPPEDLLSISVSGPDLTRVDAYATAAFAMGDTARDWIENLDGIEALAVRNGGTTWSTTHFPAVSA
jgi:FAD:protein FMN transferase